MSNYTLEYENVREFRVAEIISADTGSYEITVRTWEFNEFNETPVTAKPISSNFLQIPLPGELVFIFKGLPVVTNQPKTLYEWYYLPSFPARSNIRENRLPVVTSNTGSIQYDTVAPLQSYTGDSIIQGRFGNTIRLGSTVEDTNYTISPTWNGSKKNDPIIIISNKIKNSTQNNVEDIKNDSSSIYLTTTQKITNITLSKPLSKSTAVATYNKPQCIISADRIILQAKTDNIILDSKRRLTINSAETRIGSESATIPIPKGDILQQIINLLITAIQAGVTGPAGIYSATNGTGQLSQALSLLSNLNSTNHFINK
jgi:hypothetical protein